MAPTRKPNEGLLARVNFPLYSVDMVSSRHILVAGGGGSSKTGVVNGFVIYEVYYDGDKFVAEEVIRHETGPSVVMNCAVQMDGHRCFVAVGQESHCQLYHINMKVIGDEDLSKSDINRRLTEENMQQIRKRKTDRTSGAEDLGKANSNSSKFEEKSNKFLQFSVKMGDSIQTDFSSEPIQRVVRVSPNGKFMVTGGTDGKIRIWNFPKMTKVLEINAHTKEIDDIDFNPFENEVVTIAKDGLGVIWNTTNGKCNHKLTWTPPENTKYLFKRCRYAGVEGQQNKSRLFTISNPLGKVGRQRGFIQQWNPEDGQLTRVATIDESLASLAVRDDGRFVAVGTMFSGSVSIYVAFSLQRVLHVPGAHSMFVTGLQFLPICDTFGPPITADTEAAVISISVDNRVCVHSLPYRHTLPAWAAVFLIVGILFLTFILCSYLGL